MITSTNEMRHSGLTVHVPRIEDGVSNLQSKPLSLKRNAAWTAIGSGAYAIVQWLQISLIAHLGTSRDIGHYAVAMGVCAPAFMLSNFQLRQVQASDASGKNSFREYLGLRVLSSTFSFGLICVLAALIPGARLLMILLALFKSVESVSDIYQGLLQQHERMDYVGRSLLLKGALMLSAFGGSYYLTRSLGWAVSAMVAGQCLGLMIYDIRASCRVISPSSATGWFTPILLTFRPDFRIGSLQPLVLRVLPLGVAMMLLSLYSNLPRLILNKYMGASATGVFAAIGSIPLMGGLLVTAIGTAIAPRLSQYAATDLNKFNQLLFRLSAFGFLLGAFGFAGSILFGRYLLQFFYGSEYANHNDVLVLTAISGAFTYVTSSLGFGATARGRFGGQPWVVLVAVVVMFAAAVVLVPTQGLVGAAIATVLSSFACLTGYTFLTFWRKS